MTDFSKMISSVKKPAAWRCAHRRELDDVPFGVSCNVRALMLIGRALTELVANPDLTEIELKLITDLERELLPFEMAVKQTLRLDDGDPS